MPAWPLSGYRPKTELYGDDIDTWRQHRKRLEETHRLAPQDADYLFLLGYLDLVRRPARRRRRLLPAIAMLAADPRWCDAFLKAAKK